MTTGAELEITHRGRKTDEIVLYTMRGIPDRNTIMFLVLGNGKIAREIRFAVSKGLELDLVYDRRKNLSRIIARMDTGTHNRFDYS
ncbi:MAG TPA: hypothetical protein VNK81_03665 [Thermodesulfobacteriota bacterium]|jgi:hypothetical protein|nr:hypothetical protein [Thermodesulfobacteriota bacterium]